MKTCQWVGCKRGATRTFNIEPPNDQWLCEEHFQEALNRAAETEATTKRQAYAELEPRLKSRAEKWFRDRDLTELSELTEEQADELGAALEEEKRLWIAEKHEKPFLG